MASDSGGVKNALTAEEIEACDGIIVAADKNVETARFDGKPVLFTKVSDGIHKPEELITKIVEKKVPPPITNGSICETPFIRCLYITCHTPSFSPDERLSFCPPSSWYTGTFFSTILV